MLSYSHAINSTSADINRCEMPVLLCTLSWKEGIATREAAGEALRYLGSLQGFTTDALLRKTSS